MRNIKFRGKRTDNGEWVYGQLRAKYYKSGEIDAIIWVQKECRWYEVIDSTVGQYTGLYDKTGAEIYEGDILRAVTELYSHFGKNKTGKFTQTYYCAIWYENGWGSEVLSGEHVVIGRCSRYLDIIAKYSEVIGSTHDDLELKKQ